MESSPDGQEERCETLISVAPDAILDVDGDGIILTANPGLASLLGHPDPTLLVGTDARRLVAAADRERTEQWLRDLADSGEPRRDLDVHLVRENGSLVPVEISAAIARGAAGEPRSAVLVVHDLSLRRCAEDALRRARDYLRDVIDAVPNPIFVKDRGHRWILCNEAFAKMLGGSRERFLGRSDYEFLPKEQADVFWRKDEEVFATGGVNENEEEIDSADGVRRTILTRKQAFRDDSGADVLVGVITDLTERKRAEDLLRLTAQVFEHSAQGIVLTDPGHRILSVNRAFSEITGFRAEDVVGRNAGVLGATSSEVDFWRRVWRSVRLDGRWEGEVLNRSRDGQIYPAWLTISPVRDAAGRIQRYVTLLADASERQEREERLRWLAQHDVLTGLPNRLLLMDRLKQAMLRCNRFRTRSAVLMLDLDRFKSVNDELGHAAGDELLREAGRRMRAVVRGGDTVARIGGDEFVLVLTDVGESSGAAGVASKLVAVLGKPFAIDSRSVQVAASVGIALFPDDGIDADGLLAVADRAMYRAKAAGGGTFRIVDGSAPAPSTSSTRSTREGRVRGSAPGSPAKGADAASLGDDGRLG